MNLLISYFVLCLNLASSLELCLFQYFSLTLSKFLRINDTISSVFFFSFSYFIVFSSQYLSSCIICYFQYLPCFTICRLLGRSYFQYLSFPFAFNFNICDMPFLLPMSHNSFVPRASPNGYRIDSWIMWKVAKSGEMAHYSY